MKTLILLFIAVLLLSCDNIVSPDSTIIGTWSWLKSSGGIDGRIDTPSSTGEHITIQFTTSGYKKYVNGKLEDDLKYSIKIGGLIFNSEKIEIITYSNGWKQSYLINDSTLLLNDECYDCFQHEYKKE